MIHTATNKAKFKMFVRRLRPILGNLPVGVETIAVGLLEKLWHATSVNSPRGDIGQFADELIAEMVGWEGDATTLIGILIDCRWLDTHPEHRLIVHDWHDHAPNFVKGNATKTGGFVTVSGPALGTGPRDRPNGTAHEDTPIGTGAPNLTKPNLTKPNPTKRGGGGSNTQKNPQTNHHLFARFWQAYPVKINELSAKTVFSEIDPDENLLEKMLATIAAFRASPKWIRDDGRFIPYAENWLAEEGWNNVPNLSQPSDDDVAYERLKRKTADELLEAPIIPLETKAAKDEAKKRRESATVPIGGTS